MNMIRHACLDIVKKIKNSQIRTKKRLEREKTKVAKKYGLSMLLKNADIFSFGEENDPQYEMLRAFLRIKPVRTGSGVAPVAVMHLSECPGSCVYCPKGENAPQSYTGYEPATMRAQRAAFDPYKQVKNRLKQLKATGHDTDKCELIIMGGTFPSLPARQQDAFIKRCFDALNEKTSGTLKQAQRMNETAQHRCVGLTIETRPDYCREKHVKHMLKLGCTRVELGVQCASNTVLKKVRRQHALKDVKTATSLLKDSGLKVCYHLMLGLTGVCGEINVKKELSMVKKVFTDTGYRPDEIKIYPTLVIQGTKLYDMWKKGEYEPLTKEQTIDLIIRIKQFIPRYVRVKRIMRDISEKRVEAGPKTTNLRQLTHHRMKRLGIECQCIRCREVGHRKRKPDNIVLEKISYRASNAKEIFLSYEDPDKDILLAFLRLRLTKDKALVRELHVYGELVPLGMHSKAVQHRGYGQRLLEEAERIAGQHKKKTIQVTSGIGVREYYRRLGYKRHGFYMVKFV
jgi:elongator complex protein 3